MLDATNEYPVRPLFLSLNVKKITADLDALRSRVEELADDCRLLWADAEHNDNPAKKDLLQHHFQNAQDHSENTAEFIKNALAELAYTLEELTNADAIKKNKDAAA